MALKMAAVIAAILAGLIPDNTKAIEPFVNNNQVVHEKVFDDQELNLLEQNYQQVILATSDNNPVTPPTNRGPSNFPTPFSPRRPQSDEQCKFQIVHRIHENSALVKAAEKMGRDEGAQRDVNHLIKQLSDGNKSPGLGSESVKGLKNVSEARGRSGGRVCYRETNGTIEILAKSNKKNQNDVINILKTMGYGSK